MTTPQSVDSIGPTTTVPPYDPVPLHTLAVAGQVVAVAAGVLAMVLAVALCTVVVSDAYGWGHPPRRVAGGLISTTLSAAMSSIAMLLLVAVIGSVVHAWWLPVLVGSYIVAAVALAATPVLARMARSAPPVSEPTEGADAVDEAAA